jgi:hypothetical protein
VPRAATSRASSWSKRAVRESKRSTTDCEPA